MTKNALVKHGYQRRTLAASGHIAAAEIGHHINAGELGQQGGVVELQCVAFAIKRAGLVAHRLAVGTDGADIACRCLRVCQQVMHGLGIHTHKAVGCQGGAVQFVVGRGVEREQLLFKRWRKRQRAVRQHAWLRGAEICQHTVYTVERGARHQTYEKL